MGNYEKVLDVFLDNPTGKFYIREIARITKLNPNTVLNLVSKLEKKKLIKREKKKHIVEISADINENFKRLKRIENLRKLYDSGLIDFLKKELKPELISVIGSYSSGEDIKKSDIDIVVIAKKKEIDLEKFERKLGRKIHLLVVDYNKMSDEFYTNLINGVVLHGYIKKK